jgi:hypothetical protein
MIPHRSTVMLYLLSRALERIIRTMGVPLFRLSKFGVGS